MTPYRDTSARQSPIEKRQGPVGGSIALALLLVFGLVSLAFGLAPSYGWITDHFLAYMGAAAFGAAAIGLLFGNVLSQAGQAACPGCGAMVADLHRKGRNVGVLCVKCGHFLEGEEGYIRLTAPNTIADVPMFGAILPTRFQLPQGCVVCGGEATKTVPLRAEQLGTGQATFQTVEQVKKISSPGGSVEVDAIIGGTREAFLHVPHCDAHDDGAQFEMGKWGAPHLVFRSYPSQRAFCALNEAKPAEAAASGRPEASN